MPIEKFEHREQIGRKDHDANYAEPDAINPVARKNGIPNAPKLVGRCIACGYSQTVDLAYSIWLRLTDEPYMKILHPLGEEKLHRVSVVYRESKPADESTLTDDDKNLLIAMEKEKKDG